MFNDFFETWKNVNEAIKLSNKWRQIVFYSEGSWLTNHLSPVIRELVDSRGNRVTFFTSEKNDRINLKNYKNLKSIFIGSQSARTYLFRKFYANLMITSTPNLQSMQLKRQSESRYFYLHHSPCSTHMVYLENAFDDFDGMFCIGNYQEKEVREREKILSLRKKVLLKSGYPNFDSLKNTKFKTGDKNTILIAPSWGENSITNLCLFELVLNLIHLKKNIILRPHSMSFLKDNKKLKKVINYFKESEFFSIDRDPNSSNSMNSSELLVTDWSGISFEYILQRKPILFIDVPPKVNNKNYQKISHIPLESSMRSKIGEVVSKNDIINLNSDELDSKISKAKLKMSKNNDFISENFYNFGKSVNVICDQIEQLK
tara:strand:+ start:1420 stop:2535 length:1116 start_codon:yes stop_codon:yes gene_type:complete